MSNILTSISTIFEKVKRGEITRKSGGSLFSNIKRTDKPELISPYLHYIDEAALLKSVDSFIMGSNHGDIQALANSSVVDPQNLSIEMKQIWEKFPKEVINDIYNIYYNDSQQLTFKPHSKSNKFRYQMIEKSADPSLRVLTRESNVKSMIFTRAMVQYYLAMMAMLQQQEPEKFEEMMDKLKNPEEGKGEDGEKEKEQNEPGKGEAQEQEQEGTQEGEEGQPKEGEGQGQNDVPGSPQNQPGDSTKDSEQEEQKPGKDNPDPKGDPNPGQSPPNSSGQSGKSDTGEKSAQDLMDEITQRFNDSVAGKRILRNILDKARHAAESMEKLMDKKELDALWSDLSAKGDKAEKAYLKTDQAWLSNMEVELTKVAFNMNGLKQKIQHLLDKSVSYFSAKEIPYYENIFEADSLGGLQDYELLHPKLRLLMLEDIMIKEVKRMGKIDIYVDVSGSMSSSCGVEDKYGREISKVLFAKSMVFKMKELNLLNDVYQFESSVTYIGKTVIDILTIGGGGGTDLNKVVRSAEQNKKNAIVLTDAEDHCTEYSPYVYFIGVQGANFGHFRKDVMEQYYDNNQLLVFDGKRTYSVNKDGRAIR